MIDYEGLYKTVAKGLKDYVGCPVIRSNQNEPLPSYPYISYTITIPKSEKQGTYGVYPDGKHRKQVTQTWSITANSEDNAESVILACKASEWLDHIGTTYLNDNNVYVQRVGGITNRDNLITTDFEYRNGFDVVFSLFDVVDNPIEQIGVIETVDLDGGIGKPPTTEELLAEAEKELEEANYTIGIQTRALNKLSKRLNGGE